MTSIIKVDNIKSSNGSPAIEIDSNGRLITKAPVFTAVDFGGSGTYQNYSTGDVAPFDNVYDGTSSYYNTSTYKFTCPVDGIYNVTASGLLNTQKDFALQLYKTGTRQAVFFTDNVRGHTISYSLTCVTGDELYLVIGSNDTDLYDGTDTLRYSYVQYRLVG
jgi:hypothetical protein